MIAAASALSCSTAGLATRRPAARRPARRALAPRAFVTPVEIVQLAADAAPGSVDAPVGAIVLGAVVVTALSFAVSLGLKPGTDAAIDMQQRDSKKFNRKD